MGRTLTYEVGKLNIGRRVKVYGRTNGHGVPGTLKGAEIKHAIVHLDGSQREEKVEWASVRDWLSHNPKPLVQPPVPAAAPEVGAAVPIRITPPAPPPPPSITTRFDVYKNLATDLDSAVRDVRIAEDLVDEAMENLETARAQHTEAVDRVKALRAQVAKSLAAVDEVLVGTSAMPTGKAGA